MFKRLVVPLDGSELSERALVPALTIAQQDGGEVTLLRAPVAESVLAPPMDMAGNYSRRGLDEAANRSRIEAAEYLQTLRKANIFIIANVRSEIAEGDPAEAILGVAKERRADLIVMSTHGYSGFTRWILGSVTERVLSSAPCPVLVIRSPLPLKRMLIPLDGSPLAETALRPGLEIAAALGASVTLLRVVPEISSKDIAALDETERGLGLRVQEELNDEAETYLHAVAVKYVQPRRDVQVVVRSGPAAATILNYAGSKDIDAVTMATHGRTGLQRWVYGSVTEKVLRNSADFAMLVVRP